VNNTLNPSPATSVAGVSLRERFGNAPIASRQGTAVPFAAADGAPKAAAPAQHVMTLGSGVVRTDDARVPEPRGRQH
jgi:hypothetical protein